MNEYGWDEEDVLANVPREDTDMREEFIEIDLLEEPDLDDIQALYAEYEKLLLEDK